MIKPPIKYVYMYQNLQVNDPRRIAEKTYATLYNAVMNAPNGVIDKDLGRRYVDAKERLSNAERIMDCVCLRPD